MGDGNEGEHGDLQEGQHSEEMVRDRLLCSLDGDSWRYSGQVGCVRVSLFPGPDTCIDVVRHLARICRHLEVNDCESIDITRNTFIGPSLPAT
jgi:hypothetical protein